MVDYDEEDRRRKSFIPKGLNWLNVPTSVKDALIGLDEELVKSKKENKRYLFMIERIESRMNELEQINEHLEKLIRIEKEENEKFRQQYLLNQDILLQQAIEEMKKIIDPNEIRSTLKRVEIATKQQPPNVTRRVEVLEQFRNNSLLKSSVIEQNRKMQKIRLEEAVASLRKLAI